MDLCSITPVKQCSWMYENHYVMLLSHLVEKYPNYVEEALKHPECYKMLDNSMIEMKGAFSIERVYEAAKKVKANEIMLEDSFRDGKGTIETIKKSIKWLKENNHLHEFKLHAVCHGKNIEDFKNTFNFINNCEDVDVIGIPKVLSEWCGDRANLYDIFKNTKKEIHFLGVWYNLKEVCEMPMDVFKRVRSCDTCLPSVYTVENIDIYEDRKGTVDLEKDYPELTRERYDKVMQTIEKRTTNYQLFGHTNNF